MTERKAVPMEANGKAIDPSKANKHVVKERGKENGGSTQTKSPKKRRKVNHACVYCRRSHMTCDLERPCTRCIKRNIGHLCHDQPRDVDTKKSKLSKAGQVTDDEAPQADMGRGSIPGIMGPPSAFEDTQQRPRSSFESSGVIDQANALSLVPPTASDLQPAGLNNTTGNVNQFAGFSDAWLTAQNFHDMNSYNPNYMIGPEVTHEFNLLNDFLHSNLLEDPSIGPEDSQQSPGVSRQVQSDMLPEFNSTHVPPPASASGAARMQSEPMPPPPPAAMDGKKRRSSGIAVAKDKTREYYLQAADPSGNDNAEERMSRVLKAKHDAGLLKPFNYINGYARLGKYLDGHIAPSSKQKILRTINHFRPKFREKAQGLTDLQLLYVEMWFEKQLMDYDRVFASMAVPACCWRRTGEIFRGNKEMAELINVPVDQLRDGKIALHEILTEESMVRFWEEFGTIAFDPAHDTLLTACSLKNPDDASEHPMVKCCFSFTIRRDEHKLPALIVGNFLPHDPPQQ